MTLEIHYAGEVIRTIDLPEVDRIKDLQFFARYKSKVDNTPVPDIVNLYTYEKPKPVINAEKRPKAKGGGTVARPVAWLRKDGGLIKSFKSAKEAAVFLNASPSAIRLTINNGKVYRNKYRLAFADE